MLKMLLSVDDRLVLTTSNGDQMEVEVVMIGKRRVELHLHAPNKNINVLRVEDPRNIAERKYIKELKNHPH